MSELTTAVESDLQAAIDRLKTKGHEFSQAYRVHMANYDRAAKDPKLLVKWNQIKSYADKTKQVIQTVNNSVDKSVNWLRDVFGFNGSSLDGVDGVGALPIVPIIYVTGAIASLSWVISQIKDFDKTLNGEKSSGLLAPENLVKYAVIAGSLWMLYKKFFRGE